MLEKVTVKRCNNIKEEGLEIVGDIYLLATIIFVAILAVVVAAVVLVGVTAVVVIVLK